LRPAVPRRCAPGRILRGKPVMRLRTFAAAGLAVATTAGMAVVAVSQAQAASTCSVQYQVANDWGAGATVNLAITNGGATLPSWTLSFAFSGNQQVTNGWNGSYTQSGQNVTVTSASYNGALAAGRSEEHTSELQSRENLVC